MDAITVLLAGDVMTGRGIDQVMRAPLPPQLHEPWVQDAREYVRLAEKCNGPIPAPVAPDYVWGDALAAMDRLAPELRIVNLETALTTSAMPWHGKGIHYRMNPAHVDCLAAARIDACSLANNHVIDWGVDGLVETLGALLEAGIHVAGAGISRNLALKPAAMILPDDRRLLLFAFATETSGVPPAWAAQASRAGVALLPDLGDAGVLMVTEAVLHHRRPGDRVVVSLHWGTNWVEHIPDAQRRFAHRLIDDHLVDVLHGHSSHHPLGIEVYRDKLVLHGCGDLINDYEGIAPRGRRRSDLGCLYAATIDAGDGRLRTLRMVPMQLRRFRLTHPDAGTRTALHGEMQFACAGLGTGLSADPAADWMLNWT